MASLRVSLCIGVLVCMFMFVTVERRNVSMQKQKSDCSDIACKQLTQLDKSCCPDRWIQHLCVVCVDKRDENECDTGSNNCDQNADCTNIVGSYSCVCKPGFNGDGRTCADENECDTGSNNCDQNADCTNIVGSYSCACKPGFNGDGKTCADNNECSNPGVCHINADCTNSQGSYTCRCNDMYEGDGVNCNPKAIKGQTCTQNSDCIRDNFICSSGLCDCDVGYSYDSTSGTCVTTCRNYGADFSHQSTTYCIAGYNNAVKSVNTYGACRDYCLKASSFICKTFELWSGNCYLSAVSKTEVPTYEWSAWTGCKYYQRHCA